MALIDTDAVGLWPQFSVIDLSSLKLIKGSFISNVLKEFASDILYSVKFAGREGFLTVLIEHQSTPKPWMPIRTLHYMIQEWLECIEQGQKKLPIIYPMIFYHGKVAYPYSTDIFNLLDDPLNIAQDFLFKPLNLIDINKIDDEETRKYVWASVLQLILKHIRAADIVPHLRRLIPQLREIDQAGGLEFLMIMVTYVNDSGSFKSEQSYLETLKETLSPKTGAKIMTIAEHFTEKGRQEGLIQGQQKGWQDGRQEGWRSGHQMGLLETAKNMLAANCDISLITRVTGLSEHDIAALQDESVDVV